MTWHDPNCLCGDCESARERQSHDAEIRRIADALGMEDWVSDPTVEEIVAEIKRLRLREAASRV